MIFHNTKAINGFLTKSRQTFKNDLHLNESDWTIWVIGFVGGLLYSAVQSDGQYPERDRLLLIQALELSDNELFEVLKYYCPESNLFHNLLKQRTDKLDELPKLPFNLYQKIFEGW